MRLGRGPRLFFIVLALVPLAGSGFGLYTAARWFQAARWPRVPCVVRASRVERESDREHRYVSRVAYAYTWSGREHVGSTYQEDYRGSWDVAEADRLARAYPVGVRRSCRVDPRHPERSQLEPDDVRVPLALAGLGLVVGLVLPGLLERPGGASSIGAGAGTLLLVLGGGAFVFFFGVPLTTAWRARHWRPTPCVVESAEVRAASGSHWTSYAPDVLYRYRVGGREYRANMVNPTDVGTAWYYGPRRVVRGLPPGTRTTCFVDPTDPSSAVLERRLAGTFWFGLWPLTMAAFGLCGIVGRVAGRLPTVGTPRIWGAVALGGLTTAALDIAYTAGLDLWYDHRAGAVDPTEKGLAIMAGLLAAGLLYGWAFLAVAHGRSAARRVELSTVLRWDDDLDES